MGAGDPSPGKRHRRAASMTLEAFDFQDLEDMADLHVVRGAPAKRLDRIFRVIDDASSPTSGQA
jgi:hypothetical protein